MTGNVPSPESAPTAAERAALREGARVHGARAGRADCRAARSTSSSSARAPTRASGICAPRRASSEAARSPPGVRVLVVPGIEGRQAAGGGRGARRRLPRGRRRVARGRLLDVHRDERRPASRPARSPSAPATATSRDGRAEAGARLLASPLTAAAAAVAGQRRRSARPDGRCVVSRESGSPSPRWRRRTSCCPSTTSTPIRSSRRASSRRPTSAVSATRSSPTGADRARLPPRAARRRGRPHPRRRARTSAAARRASTRPGRSSGWGFRRHRRPVLRRHLPAERAQERAPAGGRGREPCTACSSRRAERTPARASPSICPRRPSALVGGAHERLRHRPLRQGLSRPRRRRARVPARAPAGHRAP